MTTYKIVRFYRDADKPNEVKQTGLTLEEAQKHCKSKTSCKPDVWFDGYTLE